MAYTHLFLMVLLVSLMRLSEASWPCPVPCRCSMNTVNCSWINNSPRLHQVPLPKLAVHRHPFEYLDFTGNAISSIGKEAWQAYPWAEYLVLKGNSLSRLQNSSLDGLLSLTYLDVSCNKIQIIERNAFEAVPFLQFINLSGNVIERIIYGTFRAWHGMQFLLKVNLSHNPLAVIQDPYFYRLPSLKLLDLGATEITPRILEDLLQISLQLRTLILPPKISCCLCHIKDDIEVLCDTVKLRCTEPCAVNAIVCENEEPLNRMQEEIVKVLETRKLKGSSLLSIMPERAVSNNKMLAQNYSSLTANFNLLKSIKQLMAQQAESLDVNWADKGEVKKLYLLASLLLAALKEKLLELMEDNPEAAVQTELSSPVPEKSRDEASKESVDISRQKERHARKVETENWLGTNQRSKAESWRKLAEDVDPQLDMSHLRSYQGALQSSWKRSISDSANNGQKLTASIEVGNNENDLASPSSDRNSVAVLGNGLAAQSLTEEELLNWLLHRHNLPVGEGTSKISAVDSEPTLSEISPDIKLPHGTYWEHQRTSVSPPLNFLAPQDDYLLQGNLFEAELNKKLTSLIPNVPVRKLISHVIRILKIDCTEAMMEMACAKLISRTGLLMKLFSERENVNETSSLWRSYFWPSKNVASMTTASSRKMEKPFDITASQEILGYVNGKKLLLAILVIGIVVFIFAVMSLIEMCSWRCAARDSQEGTFLGRKKKPLPDEERTGSLLMDMPLWLKDIHQPRDEMQKKNMVDKLHDEESLEDIFGWGNARPPFQEPPVKKSSSRTLSISTFKTQPASVAAPPPPSPPHSTPSRKSSLKQGSDTARGSAEAARSKAASSAADQDDEDEEGSAEKTESPTEEATTEAPESGEGEGEDEEEGGGGEEEESE